MGSTSVSVEPGEGIQPEDGKGTIRIIVADTQAIFRAGLRKIFALEDDIRVVGQAESLDQTIAAIQKFSADIVIFEAALTCSGAGPMASFGAKLSPKCWWNAYAKSPRVNPGSTIAPSGG